jgi:hypothetical protein
MTLARGEFAHTIDPLEREWLVTNGLGGFALSIVLGTPSWTYAFADALP